MKLGYLSSRRQSVSDLLIGVTALEIDYAVATHNMRHFRLIPNLAVRQLGFSFVIVSLSCHAGQLLPGDGDSLPAKRPGLAAENTVPPHQRARREQETRRQAENNPQRLYRPVAEIAEMQVVEPAQKDIARAAF